VVTVPDRFATLYTCIDGRIQRALETWVREHLGVEYVDTITEPGPEAVLATSGEQSLSQIVEKIGISQRAHGSTTLVVAAHSDCAGNPVSDEEHRNQLHQGLSRLAERLCGTKLLAVHAGRCGERCWEPELVAEVMPTCGDPSALE